METEVVIPTRGNVEMALAGLLQHAEARQFDGLRIVAAAMPATTWARRLIETLQHLGVRVVIEMQRGRGNGPATAQAIENSDAKHLLFMDDDAVLTTHRAIENLHSTLRAEFGWSAPIIRFAQGFVDPPHGHTEIWHQVNEKDPRVATALVKRGDGWLRVFDVPYAVVTDQLCGACFYAEREKLMPFTFGLWNWPQGVPGCHGWLGNKLGEGRVAPTTFCYHAGDYGNEWDHDALHSNLMQEGGDPSWTTE
jgi:hypothetical protein